MGWVLTGVFAVSALDDLRGIAVAIGSDSPAHLLAGFGYTAGYFFTLLALAWRPAWALAPFTLMLACALFTDQRFSALLFIAIILALAAYATRTIPLAIMVVAALSWELTWRVLHDAVDGRLLWPIPILLLLLLPGRAVQVMASRGHRERAKAAAREQVAHEREAALVEENKRQRLAMSRELHDVIAHEVTRIAMHSSVAQLSNEAGEQRQALQAISASARNAMTEMRRLVRLLGSNETPPPGSPGEGVGSLTLIGELERSASYLAGLGFLPEWRIEGDPAHAPSGLLPTTVTVLREATTNAVKHGSPGVRCDFTVTVTDQLAIDIRNELSDGLLDLPASGIGLTGLRGRITDLGGTFSAGSHAGWWIVHATLPISDSR